MTTTRTTTTDQVKTTDSGTAQLQDIIDGQSSTDQTPADQTTVHQVIDYTGTPLPQTKAPQDTVPWAQTLWLWVAVFIVSFVLALVFYLTLVRELFNAMSWSYPASVPFWTIIGLWAIAAWPLGRAGQHIREQSISKSTHDNT